MYVSVYICVCMSVYLSVCLSVNVCVYVCECLCMSVYGVLIGYWQCRDCQQQEFKYIARDLCYEATLLGSTDNITVQVVDVR